MRIGLLCLIVVAGCAVGCKGKEDASKAGEGSFAEVSAILGSKCVGCHGMTGKPKGGIDLRTYASVMKGGDKGVIVIAGSPAGSVLIEALRGESGKRQMPFRQAPLPEEQIQKIEGWIKAGAKQ